MKKLFFLFSLFFISFFFINPSLANDSVKLHFFYGQGCPHCAKAEVFLEKLQKKYPQLEVKSYEVYTHPENQKLWKNLCDQYNVQPSGVPMIFLGDKYFIGYGSDRTTGREIESYLQTILNKNEKPVEKIKKEEKASALTFPKIFSLALADSVNPCALAVLTLMLLSIWSLGSRKKKDILLAGLIFAFSVFVMYLFYGLVIIKLFQVVKALTVIRLYLYKILGFFALLLGFLNLKDFIHYKPGGVLTEMPMFLRPKVQNLFFKATSPKAAFWLGAFVTLFLLPCTIGPYVICGGILCSLPLIKTIPWLLFYNFIFILPMIAITLLCFFGFTAVENVSHWREKNIKYFHLIAGLLIFFLGLGMILGWF